MSTTTHDPKNATWTPQEAQQLLASLSVEARIALAQLVTMYLTMEDIPALSYAPELAYVAQPLLEAGLVTEDEQSQLHDYDADWGPIADDYVAGVALDTSLIGAVGALIAGVPWDGDETLERAVNRDSSVRVFQLGQWPGAPRSATPETGGQA